MHMRTKTVIALVVLALLLAASVSLKVYFSTSHVAAMMFWRGDEAYLFLGTGHTGHRFSFFAMCSGAVLCKWTANGFELATEEEQRRHDGVNRLVRGSMNNQIVNGWHVRGSFRSPGDHAEVEIGKDLVISVRNHAADVRAYPWVSVDLLRPGQEPESLYSVDGTPRRVSKSEYDRTFREP